MKQEFVDRHTRQFFRLGDTYTSHDRGRLEELGAKGYVEDIAGSPSVGADGQADAKRQTGKKPKAQRQTGKKPKAQRGDDG